MAWKVDKKNLVTLILFKIVLAFLPLLDILLIEKVINSVTEGLSNKRFSIIVIYLLIAHALVMLTGFVIQRFLGIINNKLGFVFECYIKNLLLSEAKGIPYIEYENSAFQNKFHRVMGSQRNMLSILDSGSSFFQNTLAMITIFSYMINIDALLCLILFMGLIPLCIVQVKHAKSRFNLTKSVTEIGRMENYIEDLLVRSDSLKEIRLNNLEDYFISRRNEYFKATAKKKTDLEKKQTSHLLLGQIFLLGTYIASGLYIYYLVISGSTLTIGIFVAVLQSIQRSQGTIWGITDNGSMIYESSLYVEEFRNFLSNIKKTVDDKQFKIDEITEIKATKLDFTYPGSTKKALEDIHLS
jgi:ATP-binding cassette, subfamily B, bacterial